MKTRFAILLCLTAVVSFFLQAKAAYNVQLLNAPSVWASAGTYSDKVVVVLSEVSGASYYRLFVAYSQFGPKYAVGDWQTNRTYNVTGLSYGTKYYFFGQASSSWTGYPASSYSAPHIGYLGEWKLNAPEVTAVSQGIYDDTLILSCSAVPGANYYRFSYSVSPEESGPNKYSLCDWQTNRTIAVTKSLIKGAKYYFYAQAASSSTGGHASDYSKSKSGYMPGSSGDIWDPGDNTASGGTPLSPTTTLQTHGPHVIDETDEFDFYKIPMTAGRRYMFQVIGSSSKYTELFDSVNVSTANGIKASGYVNCKLIYTPTKTQTFYLRIKHNESQKGMSGSYLLKYCIIPEDKWEPDETTDTATEITPTITQQIHGPHILDDTDTFDYFKMFLVAGNTYEFKTTGDADTKGHLYRGSLNTYAAYDEAGGEGANFRISYTPSVSDMYYLKVEPYRVGSTTMVYSLSFREVSSSLPDIKFTPTSDVESWSSNAFLTDSADSKVEKTSFFTGQPIYVRYLFSESHYKALSRQFSNRVELLNEFEEVVYTDVITVDSMRSGCFKSCNVALPILSAGSYTVKIRLNTNSEGMYMFDESTYSNNNETISFKVVPPVETSSAILITGPDCVFEGRTGVLMAKEVHSDGSKWTITPKWSISNGSSYATINAKGVLTGKTVESPQPVNIQASYTEDGVMKTAYKTVTICPTLPLATALDNFALTFTTGGNAGWFGQGETTYDGTDAARSGVISENQNSWMQTVVYGPGTFSFRWYASSESGASGWNDYLSFSIDGIQTNKIGGTSCSWTQCSYTLGSGRHVLRWNYLKDGVSDRGEDAGFIDQIVWTPTVGTYTICFDKGDGMDTQTFKCPRDVVFNLPGNLFTPPSWKRFAGWKGSNGKRYDDKMLVINPVPAGEVLTLTAIWE